MKLVSGKKFGKILKKKGWVLLRVHGSHHIYGREGSVVRLSVPIHGNKPLKEGLLTHLAKLAGVTEDELK
jgi:predicted RNA binding protein YcfA (HicA-like mRNA interferase family)